MITLVKYHRGEPPTAALDEVAEEEPLEIRVNGRPVSITMRTPGHDRELAAGFLLSEGIVSDAGEIAVIEPALRAESCNVIEVTLSPNVELDVARLTRHVFASSSCGLCGKASIDAVHQNFPPISSDLVADAHVLFDLPERLRESQSIFSRTGGLHAAAVFDPAGRLVVLHEDVGRHNAVDKVLGHALIGGSYPFDHHILLVSGRASFEILQKALAGRLPIVAAVSAPSSLAVRFANESRQTLIGFLRDGRMNVYSGGERIRAPGR